MGMPKAVTYKMPKELLSESINWLGDKHADIITYLEERGFTTMEDVVDRQSEIPTEYMVRIKGKLIFGVDL